MNVEIFEQIRKDSFADGFGFGAIFGATLSAIAIGITAFVCK